MILDRSPLDWIEKALAQSKTELIPLTPAIAVLSTQLGPSFHGDPADRIIAASTQILSARLLTKDKKLRAYSKIQSLW